MSESEKEELGRRSFLKKFAVGAAVAPVVVSGGLFGAGCNFPGHPGHS